MLIFNLIYNFLNFLQIAYFFFNVCAFGFPKICLWFRVLVANMLNFVPLPKSESVIIFWGKRRNILSAFFKILRRGLFQWFITRKNYLGFLLTKPKLLILSLESYMNRESLGVNFCLFQSIAYCVADAILSIVGIAVNKSCAFLLPQSFHASVWRTFENQYE